MWIRRCTRLILGTLGSLWVFGCAPGTSSIGLKTDPTSPATGSYSTTSWAAVLSDNVKIDGVDYHRLAQNVEPLEQFVAMLGRCGPKSNPALFEDRAARLAYWLNAYNASVLLAVVQAGVPPTMHDPAQTPFRDRVRFRIDGRVMTLNDIRERVRKEADGDPRVWFCLSDAAKGSPPLLDQPFLPVELEKQLVEAARRAMSESELVKVDHEAGELLLGVPLIENRDELIDAYRRTTGKAEADLLDVVISLAGTMRGAWFANARGYPVKIIPFDSALNVTTASP